MTRHNDSFAEHMHTLACARGPAVAFLVLRAGHRLARLLRGAR